MYENNENILVFYRFKFYDKDEKEIGTVQNLSDRQYNRAITRDGF